MEKRTPHTRLSQVKKLVNAGQVRTTRSALLNADELGLDFDGMCNVIIGLSESDFCVFAMQMGSLPKPAHSKASTRSFASGVSTTPRAP